MIIQKLADMALHTGERVVSMVAYHDYVLVITDGGSVYKLIPEEGP